MIAAFVAAAIASIVVALIARRLDRTPTAEPLPGTKWVIPTVGVVTIYDIYGDVWGSKTSGAATIAYWLPDQSQICRIDRYQFMRTASPYIPAKKNDPRDDPEYREWLKIKLEIDRKS